MLTIVIQAGGASSRMGKDKGLMLFNRLPLAQRLVERLSSIADETLIVTNNPEAYKLLPTPKVSDVLPGRGALGGLLTALQCAKHPLVGVVACDMPFVNPDLFRYQMNILDTSSIDVCIPRINGQFEPMHAVYRKATCLPLVEQAIAQDQWKMISWFKNALVREVSADEVRRFDPHNITFTNVNTPIEFQIAESLDRSIFPLQ